MCACVRTCAYVFCVYMFGFGVPLAADDSSSCCSSHTHTHTRVQTHTYTHTQSCTHTHTHTRTHKHTRIHKKIQASAEMHTQICSTLRWTWAGLALTQVHLYPEGCKPSACSRCVGGKVFMTKDKHDKCMFKSDKR
jgi:hypothetical protein